MSICQPWLRVVALVIILSLCPGCRESEESFEGEEIPVSQVTPEPSKPQGGMDIEIVFESEQKSPSSSSSKKAQEEDIPENWQLAEDQNIDIEVSAPKKADNKVQPNKDNAVAQPKKAETEKFPKQTLPKDEPLNGKSAKFEINIDYKKLLKDPQELGFIPDKELFRECYRRIRTSYVDDVNDDKLEKGVVSEVSKLVKAAGKSPEGLQHLDKKFNILSQIEDLYAKDINKELLTYSAIQGMLVGLGDPFSVLMTPKEYASLQEEVQTKGFGGIGIYIEADKDNANQITVFEPMEGAPACKAGVEAGDQILAINNESTKNMALDIATKKIRGPVGSSVALKIRRKGVDKPFVITVKRESIHVVSCRSKMYGQTGYIRISQFGASTSEEFAKEFSKLKEEGATSLILDLRNNGGGIVDAAVGIGSQLLPKGKLIVYTVDRRQKREDLKSKGNGSIEMPMIVLINRFSASASEITAGYLRDHKIAKLVGERSFGKGSVQTVFPFNDGSALKMTIARFYSPSGHVIDHNGLIPDVSLEMEPRFVARQGKDTQLEKALQMLRN